MLSFSAKKKEGVASQQVGENKLFWADTNFWPIRCPGVPKILPGQKCLSSWYPPQRIFHLNTKQKRYDTLKSVNCEFGRK